MTVPEMKRFEDKSVVLRCADGEVITARITFVDEEYQDVIVDIKSTTKPQKWPAGHPTSANVYTITLAEIVAVKEIR